jgi:beta-barrel assembly-enhancing protease
MSYDPYQQGDEQPSRSRQPRRRDPRESENSQDEGLGGLLGGILGGGQRRPQPEEDPRYRQQRRGPVEEEQMPMDPRMGGAVRSSGRSGGCLGILLSNPRIGMALLMAVGALVMYFVKNKQEYNPVTDLVVRVPWEPAQDVPLGLQAAPQMMAQHGGEHPDPQLQALVDKVGNKLVRDNAVGDWAPVFQQYQWDFHLLRDPETINAFALPGGQIFFTYGLFKKLETEDEVAGVMGHEIGHVIARHSAVQMAKHQLITGITMAGTIATSDGQGNGQMAQVIGNMIGMKYGREDETQADTLGVQFMINSKYNPNGLIKVMEVLKAAMGGQRQPEFMSTHPDPGNRVEHIKSVIQAMQEGKLEGPKALEARLENSRSY